MTGSVRGHGVDESGRDKSLGQCQRLRESKAVGNLDISVAMHAHESGKHMLSRHKDEGLSGQVES